MSEASFHRHLPRESALSHQSPGQNESFVTLDPNGTPWSPESLLQTLEMHSASCCWVVCILTKSPGLYPSDSLTWGLYLPLTFFPGSSLGLSHTGDLWVSAEERYPPPLATPSRTSGFCHSLACSVTLGKIRNLSGLQFLPHLKWDDSGQTFLWGILKNEGIGICRKLRTCLGHSSPCKCCHLASCC